MLKIAACLNRFTTITLVNVGLAEKEQTCKMNGIFMASYIKKTSGGKSMSFAGEGKVGVVREP